MVKSTPVMTSVRAATIRACAQLSLSPKRQVNDTVTTPPHSGQASPQESSGMTSLAKRSTISGS